MEKYHFAGIQAGHAIKLPLDADYVILAFRDDEKVFFQSANDDNYKYLNRFFYTLGEKFFYFREAG